MKKALTIFKKMFFKYGINIFDRTKIEYGGYNHLLGEIISKIFCCQMWYLNISLQKPVLFIWHHERDEDLYDGYYNSIQIIFLQISYGT